MIPFVPFPTSKAVKISRPFFGLANKFLVLFPYIDTKLLQAGLPFRGREYMSIALLSSLFWLILTGSLLAVVGLLIKNPPPNFVAISFLTSSAISLLSFFYIISYPNTIVIKKTKDIDKNLLFALRHLMIQVKSGVLLFDAFISISRGNYGLVSTEFGNATKKITTGKAQSIALEEITYNNPSLYFRRTMWQLSTALKSGADLGNTLEVLVQSLANEQRIAIRKYGAQLSPLALMYMMFAAIMPTLGITFLIVFSSISGFTVSDSIFYIILAILGVFQFAFSGLIKNSRPVVEL